MQLFFSVADMTACGARRNLRVTAVTVLDFYRPLRFSRPASSARGGNPQRSRVRVGVPLWRRKARQQSPFKNDPPDRFFHCFESRTYTEAPKKDAVKASFFWRAMRDSNLRPTGS